MLITLVWVTGLQAQIVNNQETISVDNLFPETLRKKNDAYLEKDSSKNFLLQFEKWKLSKLSFKRNMVKGEEWYTFDTVWIYSEQDLRYVYEYNEHGYMTLEHIYYMDNGIWKNKSRTVLTYNEMNFPLTELIEKCVNDQWQLEFRVFATYNEHNNPLTWQQELWRDGKIVNSSIWDFGSGSRKYTLSYNEHNNELSEQIAEFWVDTEWVNREKYTLTYDINNNRDTLIHETWSNGWNKNRLTTYKYDENFNEVLRLVENWRNDDWELYYKKTFTYDENNNLLTELEQDWTNDDWVNYEILTYTYDENNNRLSYLRERWRNNDWQNNINYTWTFDENSNMTSEIYDTWNNNTLKWVNVHTYIWAFDEYNNMLFEQKEPYSSTSKGDRRTWTYEENNKYPLTIVQEANYSGGGYETYSRGFFTFDEYKNLLLAEHERPVNNKWVNDFKFALIYDENHNCILNEYWKWDNDDWHCSLPFNNAQFHLFHNNMQIFKIYKPGYKVTQKNFVRLCG